MLILILTLLFSPGDVLITLVLTLIFSLPLVHAYLIMVSSTRGTSRHVLNWLADTVHSVVSIQLSRHWTFLAFIHSTVIINLANLDPLKPLS